MLAVRYENEREMLEWAAQRIGLRSFFSDAHAIGQTRNGELCAVVVYDRFGDTDCNMHVASDGSGRWISRDLLVRAFAYPFIQCGKRRINALVEECNTAAIRFDEHIGFKREGYHPHACASGALISFGMLREDCRYIPLEYRHG